MIINPLHVNVEFIKISSLKEISEKISLLTDVQIILWYIGCNGLRQTSVHFYRDFLISPLLKNAKPATFWLVDLTAWNAFKKNPESIFKTNSCCEIIEKFPGNQIRCIRSADIFKKAQNTTKKEIIEYFRVALRRDFISKMSMDFPPTSILVKQVFPDGCPLAIDWYEYDVSKAYSVFQYLESCFLVEEVFKRTSADGFRSKTEIIFVLPNDELDYYQDDADSFKKDIEFLISKQFAFLAPHILEIKFYAFSYGSQLKHRPYNAPGGVMKRNSLSYETVTGINMEISTPKEEMAEV